MRILLIFIIFILIFLLDFIWLSFIIGDFFFSQTQSFARINKGSFDIIIWSTLTTWLLMAIGIYYFVIKNSKTISQSALLGFLFGFILYGVFDFTNYSFIKGYTISFLIVDILWGSFLCFITSMVSYYVKVRFKI